MDRDQMQGSAGGDSEGWGGEEEGKLEGQHQRTTLYIDSSPGPPVCFSQSLLPPP